MAADSAKAASGSPGSSEDPRPPALADELFTQQALRDFERVVTNGKDWDDEDFDFSTCGRGEEQQCFLWDAVTQDPSGRVCRALIAAGVPVDFQNAARNNDSMLIVASRRGFVDAVVVLLGAGANPELRDALGHEALTWAANGTRNPAAAASDDDYVRIVEVLGAARASGDFLSSSVFGEPTPLLHRAAERRLRRLTQLLVGAGADVNELVDCWDDTFRERTGRLQTPLYHACLGGDVEVVRCLLDAGADVWQQNGGERAHFNDLPVEGCFPEHHLDAAALVFERQDATAAASAEAEQQQQQQQQPPQQPQQQQRRQYRAKESILRKLVRAQRGEGDADDIEMLQRMRLEQDKDVEQCASCQARPPPSLQQCSGCKGVAYCNQACQTQHWGAHKKACKRRRKLLESLPQPEQPPTR